MAGSGSLFCTYIGFPSPDCYVRALFRVSSVGFFTFTLIGYSYGYESSSSLKKAAFRLALLFSSGGLGLCGAYWMDAVPRLLLLILSIFTCLFQAVCVHFQLNGSGLLLHTGLTALLPALASVGPGGSSDVIQNRLSSTSEQEARILQADDGESDETTWAYKIIVAAVCVIVGTVFLAVCGVWQRRHGWFGQEAQRVVEWQDVTIGRIASSDHDSSLEERNSDTALSVEAVPDDGSRALPADIIVPGRLDSSTRHSNGDVQAESQTRSLPMSEKMDEEADAGKAEDRITLHEDQVDVQLPGSEEDPIMTDAGNAGEALANMMQVFSVLGSMSSDLCAPLSGEGHAVAFDALEELHDDVRRDLHMLTTDTLSLSGSSGGSCNS
eukprot:TRINITY_DN8832_c1_g1_i2.p1 TRINITY_DN8832_c1_g1~~TRINITY_DN8832_c1_g1_i2.p1  ORF type:complete len:432 (+),score=45.94 TRINITY_DN8832_c1_g1_i2:151-1296(+)